MLDNFHKSIFWIVRVSVLHDFCRAWFWTTEGRTWSVHPNVSKVSLHAVALSSCKATVSAVRPAATESGQLSLRGSQTLAAPMETSLLSHQLLSCSLFLISQEAPRGRCLDCHRSISLSSHTVFNSHKLFFFLSSLSTFFSVLKFLSTLSLSLSFSLYFQIYSSRGWFVYTPGQLIWFPFSICETAAIPKRPKFVDWAFHIRVHYFDWAPRIITSY